MIEILKIFGLGVLGIVLYAFGTIWQKVQREGFEGGKFFKENKWFWGTCIVFNFLLSLLLFIVPESGEVLHALGFAVEADNYMGYVLLGIALGAGSDKTSLTGTKTLINK